MLVILPGASAQTLGGATVFNFLNLPAGPQTTALGGITLTQPTGDPSVAFYNPALLQPEMHTAVAAVFNDFYAGIKGYHLSGAWRSERLGTDFLAGVQYLDYGSVPQTDAAGNILGSFRPVDWVMQVGAARNYMSKWKYGANVKFIHSGYGIYRSSGAALDVGVLYRDSTNGFSASVLARNMGFQFAPYDGTDPGDLPFDLEVGATQRLAHAPFSFSITAHHLHQFDNLYNDTSFNNENGFRSGSGGRFTFDRLFRHIILASTVYIGDRVEVELGYNHLRRKELSIGDGGNGLNGFSMGVGVLLNKIQLRYARSQYQRNTAYNQVGINLKWSNFISRR